MKTLAKYHVCNNYRHGTWPWYCVIGEKTFKNILIGPGKLLGLSRNGPLVWNGVLGNYTFWSELESGFGEQSCTPPPIIPNTSPTPPPSPKPPPWPICIVSLETNVVYREFAFKLVKSQLHKAGKPHLTLVSWFLCGWLMLQRHRGCGRVWIGYC